MWVYTLPMFPLGNVVFPHMMLPLHIFEERYRTLMEDVYQGDGLHEFGVVLIERGSEVGGNDERTSVGTAVRILDAERLDDGRWVVVSAGVRRIRVLKWLEEAPYPRASVEDVKDLEPGADIDELRSEVVARLRQVAARQAELGDAGLPVDFELSPDPTVASFQACAVSPIGPLDAQQLLVIDDPGVRLRELHTLLVEQLDTLELRLSQG